MSTGLGTVDSECEQEYGSEETGILIPSGLLCFPASKALAISLKSLTNVTLPVCVVAHTFGPSIWKASRQAGKFP